MVEWKKLKEIVAFERGRALSKNDLGVGDAPIILYGELYTTYGDYINNIVSVTLQERARSATLLYYGDIVLPVSSTTKESQIGKASVIKTKERVSLGSDAIILRNSQNASYLMYYLNSSLFERDKMSCVSGTTIMHLSPTKLAEKTIPIPSLEEQNRIVGILDTFTSAIDNLKEQIAQRRKQYEYYRDQLLDLEGKEGVEMKKLGEICVFIRGPFGGALKKEIFINSGYAIYEQQHAIYGQWDFRYYIDSKKFEEMKRFEVHSGDIIMSCSGTMGKTSIVPDNHVPGIINQALLKLSVKPVISNRFLKLFMDSRWFQEGLKNKTAGGAIQNVASVSVLKELEISLPSLSEQSRIVSILDTFEASIANLEAQLKEREKQYEYYRNKLLTFE